MAGNRNSGRARVPVDKQATRHPAQIYMDAAMYVQIRAIAEEECEGIVAQALRKLCREALAAREEA